MEVIEAPIFDLMRKNEGISKCIINHELIHP